MIMSTNDDDDGGVAATAREANSTGEYCRKSQETSGGL